MAFFLSNTCSVTYDVQCTCDVIVILLTHFIIHVAVKNICNTAFLKSKESKDVSGLLDSLYDGTTNTHSGSWVSPGLPPSFKLPLVNQEVTEGNSVILRCELTKPAPSVEWRRGVELLWHGDKYQMRKKDMQVELKIIDTSLEDMGDYTCICGEQKTTASVIVNGE